MLNPETSPLIPYPSVAIILIYYIGYAVVPSPSRHPYPPSSDPMSYYSGTITSADASAISLGVAMEWSMMAPVCETIMTPPS